MQVLREGAVIRERDFQRWLMDVARRLGWSVWHVPSPMRWDTQGGKGFVGARDAAGLSDLIMVRNDYLVFAEVKGSTGKVSAKQLEFLTLISALRNPRVLAFLWKPGDEEEAQRVLAKPEAFTARS